MTDPKRGSVVRWPSSRLSKNRQGLAQRTNSLACRTSALFGLVRNAQLRAMSSGNRDLKEGHPSLEPQALFKSGT